jgi:hypothetical protein
MRPLAAMGLLLAAAANAFGSSLPDIKIQFERAFIPQGFETRDETQVVMAGTLPDTCYKPTRVETQVDKAAKVITITQWAAAASTNCLPMIVPFYSVVKLGRLEAGEYELRDEPSQANLGSLEVLPSKDPGGGSDYLNFAPLSDAYVETDPVTGRLELVLEGSWLDRCSRFKEIQVVYQSDVIVVKPIIESESGSRKCGSKRSRAGFTERVALKAMSLPYLLHVRLRGGEAINKLYLR